MSRQCKQCDVVLIAKPKTVSGPPRLFCSDICRRAHRKAYERQWLSANRDRVREYRDQIRDSVRKWNREFYARHRERRKRARVEIYRANPDKALKAARRYSQEHPDTIRAIGRKSRQKRRALMMSAFVETVDPMKVFERDGGYCKLCGGLVDVRSRWHVDHVIPISKGGVHSYANSQLSHARCNQSKGARVA